MYLMLLLSSAIDHENVTLPLTYLTKPDLTKSPLTITFYGHTDYTVK